MMQDRLNVTFVGHVDHGKSTLIGRLLYDTGSLPPDRMEQVRLASQEQGKDIELAFLIDQLKEERDEAKTIDTAQVFFEAQGRRYVIIDAPGHREFLKNMLTGASQAQAAVLIVDTELGMGEQTRRHAFLLDMLGIHTCVCALNKMDRVEFAQERFAEVEAQVRAHLDRVGLAVLACVPISARHGDNVVNRSERMAWYPGPTLMEALAGIRAVEQAELPMRLCVQDVYTFEGERIVAGRVEIGTLDDGDPVLVLPDGVPSEVYAIERFLSTRTTAEPGECIGLTMPEQLPVRRGQVFCAPDDPPAMRSRLTARLFWMSAEPLRPGETLDLKVVTQCSEATVRAIRRRTDSSSLDLIAEDADVLEEHDVAEVDLDCAQAMVVERAARSPSLGRVVMERGGEVVAAGIVIDL